MSSAKRFRSLIGGCWPRAPTSNTSISVESLVDITETCKGVIYVDYLNVEILEKRLERNKEERILLEGLLQHLKTLHRFDGAEQLPLTKQVPAANSINGRISFPNGLRQVLQRADGKPMKATEIWAQMKALGVVSNAQRPMSFISLHAKKHPQIEALGKNIFRWIGD